MSKLVTFQVVDNGLLAKTQDPAFWRAYRAQVIQEITMGAMDTIRDSSAKLWAHSTGGGIDQSWHSRTDPDRGIGHVWNSKPYAYWLNYGVQAHKMRYLLLNNRGIYFVTKYDPETDTETVVRRAKIRLELREEGRSVIRTVTEESMAENPSGPPWWHPGLPKLGFMQAGLKQYRDFKLKNAYKGLTVRIFGGSP